jgi:serine/threonine protein phosphatase PrpC
MMWKALQFQGKRDYMEDRFIVQESFYKDYDLYAVFDGHGGDFVAEFCRRNILTVLSNELEKTTNIHNALHDTFIILDKLVPLHQSYMTGTTCLVVLVSPSNAIIANCGDSRAIANSNDVPIALSKDHKPITTERTRIQELGGHVIQTQGGVWRVSGELAVSRAIGDKHLRPYVIPNPEVFQIDFVPSNKFIVIATDGLWDIMTNNDVVNIIHSQYIDKSLTDNVVLIHSANKLLSSIFNTVEDNTTVLIVHIRR